MKQTLTTKLYSDGEDRTLLQCHAVDWTSKVLYVLEFKRTSDQGQNYRERGKNRASSIDMYNNDVGKKQVLNL